MTSRFERLYEAKPFDENSRIDQIGESARLAVLDAAIAAGGNLSIKGGEETSVLLGGLLIGAVQIMQASLVQSDETDAAILASIQQIAPWAVEMARSCQGKDALYRDCPASGEK